LRFLCASRLSDRFFGSHTAKIRHGRATVWNPNAHRAFPGVREDSNFRSSARGDRRRMLARANVFCRTLVV